MVISPWSMLLLRAMSSSMIQYSNALCCCPWPALSLKAMWMSVVYGQPETMLVYADCAAAWDHLRWPALPPEVMSVVQAASEGLVWGYAHGL